MKLSLFSCKPHPPTSFLSQWMAAPAVKLVRPETLSVFFCSSLTSVHPSVNSHPYLQNSSQVDPLLAMSLLLPWSKPPPMLVQIIVFCLSLCLCFCRSTVCSQQSSQRDPSRVAGQLCYSSSSWGWGVYTLTVLSASPRTVPAPYQVPSK